jgi:hypothetical protein
MVFSSWFPLTTSWRPSLTFPVNNQTQALLDGFIGGMVKNFWADFSF